MYEYSAESLILSFVLTWVIGLLPPILIRFAITRKPIGKFLSGLISFIFLIINVILFSLLGSQSKTHGALMLVALVSYFVMSRPKHSLDEKATEDIASGFKNDKSITIPNTAEQTPSQKG